MSERVTAPQSAPLEHYASLDSIYLGPAQAQALVRLVETASQVQRRSQFFVWVQSHLDVLLPHDLMVCGVYSRERKQLQYTLFNNIALPPGVTEALHSADSPLLRRAAALWVRGQCQPLSEPLDAQSTAWSDIPLAGLLRGAGLRQLLVHGVSRPDRPHEIETLFVLVTATPATAAHLANVAVRLFDLVLPHLHATYMRIQGAERDFRAAPLPAPPPLAEKAATGITGREVEILHWVREGKSNQDISALLGISALTVKNHIQNVLRKLGASNRAHAVTLAERLQLLPGDPRRSEQQPGRR